MYRHFFKRIIDLMVSFVTILILSPLFLVVTLWLHIANKGAGAFFLQERPGLNAKPFKVIKYKTMTDKRDANGKLLPDVKRLTKVGKFVRATSIDELPQLFNVLKGDMSLVGPRPLLMKYLLVYDATQMRRHEVRPGITGWAQVHGRNLLKLSKKFEYDVWYVDHCTILTDLKIIWLSVKNVLSRKDIGEGAGNMKEVDDLHFAERLKEYNKIHID